MLFRNDKKDNRDGAAAELVPLLPLRELIVFPHEVYPIFVGRQKSIKALEAAEAAKKPILLVAQKDARVADPSPSDIYSIGTLAIVPSMILSNACCTPSPETSRVIDGLSPLRAILSISSM